MVSWWQRLLGKKPVGPPALPTTLAPEPQHLGSEDEAFLSQLVSDLADGKRRDEIASPEVLRRLDGLWTAGHERLAIDWMEKLLGVPEIPETFETSSEGARPALELFLVIAVRLPPVDQNQLAIREEREAREV